QAPPAAQRQRAWCRAADGARKARRYRPLPRHRAASPPASPRWRRPAARRRSRRETPVAAAIFSAPRRETHRASDPPSFRPRAEPPSCRRFSLADFIQNLFGAREILVRHHDPPLDRADAPLQNGGMLVEEKGRDSLLLQNRCQVGNQDRIIASYQFFHIVS